MKKISVFFTEILVVGSGLTAGTVLSSIGLGSSVGIANAAASSFIASVVGLITVGFCSKLKLRSTKLRDGIKLTTVLN